MLCCASRNTKGIKVSRINTDSERKRDEQEGVCISWVYPTHSLLISLNSSSILHSIHFLFLSSFFSSLLPEEKTAAFDSLFSSSPPSSPHFHFFVTPGSHRWRQNSSPNIYSRGTEETIDRPSIDNKRIKL